MNNKDNSLIIKEATSVVGNYLHSRQEHLKTDPTEALKTLYARQRVPMDVEINHENDSFNIHVGKVDLELLDTLLTNSEHDLIAWKTCELIENDKNTPLDVKYLIAKKLGKEPKKRGTNPLKNYMRDFTISLSVFKAIRSGVPEFSKGNNIKPTACSIVSKELEIYGIYITPEGIEKIWIKYRD
jgi:hypothetical protein|tara:strand:+ start:358 stop:909 length:552 start_codon:yes stop_codon:yes gene_type:complete